MVTIPGEMNYVLPNPVFTLLSKLFSRLCGLITSRSLAAQVYSCVFSVPLRLRFIADACWVA